MQTSPNFVAYHKRSKILLDLLLNILDWLTISMPDITE
jgi:hypothetical protein